jgi:hypothetical protein
MSARDHISMETKLAAALLALGHIPYEHAKLMTAAQIISLYNFDHYPIRKADNGPDEPWNLVPLGIMAHRKKTADKDVPELRKADRLAKARAALDVVLATGEKPPRPTNKRRIPSRPFQKGHRPLRSRSSFERRAP